MRRARRGPHRDGPRGALERAFGGRAVRHTEAAWRSHLARLGEPGGLRTRRGAVTRTRASAARGESVFAPRYRAMSVGVLMSVTVVAFQALGVGTVMPAVARELDGLERYGWAFSAFMLASMVGSVAAGQDADRAGPVRRVLGAIASFTAGSVLAARRRLVDAAARGRALEGLGAGALGVVTYASASRAYPPEMYGRMLALMSSAWVLPSLAGPAVAGLIADHTKLALGVRAAAAVPAGRGGADAAGAARARAAGRRCRAPRRLPQALALAAGTALFLARARSSSAPLLLALAAPPGSRSRCPRCGR